MPTPDTVETSASPVGRNHFIDLVRAFSLVIVVVWHTVFTILVWRPDGPHATSPIGFIHGFFLLTWLLQVMPLFFFVGGYAHLQAWTKASAKGTSILTFTGRRAKQLAAPAGLLIAAWVLVGIGLEIFTDFTGIWRMVQLVLSPLWFLCVYLLLIALLPLALRLHQRYDYLVLVVAAGLAGLVDIIRFTNDLPAIGWLNMILVWGFCHQLGLFYDRLVSGGTRLAWAFVWSGLFGLFALVYPGFYPGSMVGVPGDRFSNMAPPTLPLICLVVFQAGVILLLRPAITYRLATRPRWLKATTWLAAFSMPLFLLHTTGLALSRGVWHWIRGGQETRTPDLIWWATRPGAFLGALVCTLPVFLLFAKPLARAGRGHTKTATSQDG